MHNKKIIQIKKDTKDKIKVNKTKNKIKNKYSYKIIYKK